ncbi:MAG: hypothetical protein HYU78_16165 [Rhodocyclales bacterium]|nr:hypothetical protein [Rhodocyclales bacterium]
MVKQIPKTTADNDAERVFERPDGFYWRSPVDGEEFGPFPTLGAAVRDMQESEVADVDDMDLESDETLAEAEDEIGIADWIDPETGEPAEDGVPRLEQH